jgi:hypothetical protein
LAACRAVLCAAVWPDPVQMDWQSVMKIEHFALGARAIREAAS